MYQLARAALTKYHRLGDLNNRNALSHGSGGWKSKITVSAGLVPSGGCKGESVLATSPWLVDGHLLPVSLHLIFPLHVSVS